MFRKGFLTLSAALLLMGILARPAFAVDVPSFPSCPNSSGTLISSYDDGIHGIVGDTASHTGSDRVYRINSDQVQQCFCAADNQGIQTNWWKISGLDSEGIQVLKNLGWYFVPNGSLWGLDNASYVAQNTSFSCGSNGGGGGGGGGGGSAPVCDSAVPAAAHLNSVTVTGSGQVTLNWNAADRADHYTISYGLESGNYLFGVPNTGNVTSYTVGGLDPAQKYCFAVTSVNYCQPGPISNEICTGGEVLGLATTGNSFLFYLLAASGAAFVLTGALLYRKSSR